MVLGVGTGLIALGLALPTGLAFGYGYGYGVRQGYSAFKPPSQGVNDLKMSPDPIQGSLGMGLQTAEERTQKTIVPPGGIDVQEPAVSDKNLISETGKDKYVTNSVGVRRLESEVKKDRETWRKFA